jgi:3-oxoacyl-[acyl-carrier-protein] synthase III
MDSGRLRPGDWILAVMAGYGLNWQAALLRASAG